MTLNNSRDGFTLVEVLVVMSIIAIVASLVIPIASNARRNSYMAICASNERQIVAGCLSYAISNEGRLPSPASAWSGVNGSADFVHGSLLPFIAASPQARAQIMRCPADDLEQYCSYGTDVIPPPYRNFSYSMNINIDDPILPGLTVNLGYIKNGSEHVILYEEFAPNDSLCFGPTDGDDWLTGRHGPRGAIEHRATYGDSAWRREGRGNVGYFDGHVGTMTVSEYFNNNSLAHPGVYYHFAPLNQ